MKYSIIILALFAACDLFAQEAAVIECDTEICNWIEVFPTEETSLQNVATRLAGQGWKVLQSSDSTVALEKLLLFRDTLYNQRRLPYPGVAKNDITFRIALMYRKGRYRVKMTDAFFLNEHGAQNAALITGLTPDPLVMQLYKAVDPKGWGANRIRKNYKWLTMLSKALSRELTIVSIDEDSDDW